MTVSGVTSTSGIGAGSASPRDAIAALQRQENQLERKIREAIANKSLDAKTREQEVAAYQAQLAAVQAQIAELKAKQTQQAASHAGSGGAGAAGGSSRKSTVHVVA